MIGQGGRIPARWTVVLPMVGALFAIFVAPARGKTLTEALFAGALGVEATAPFVFTLQQTAARGTDFPATATTPGFTYRYNPELNMFERAPGTLGPAFLERGETMGKGRSDVGISYLRADFTEINGEDLDEFSDGFLFDSTGVRGNDAAPARAEFEEFSLVTHAFYFFATHGLTERWDVNVLFPVYLTLLDARFRVMETDTNDFRGQRFRADETAAGIGDLQLRTKYRLAQRGNLQLASGLTLRIPTGEEEDFHGIGDYTVTPQMVLSYAEAFYDLHISLGVEADADDLERSRARYGIGGSIGILKRLTGNIDIIGTSAFVDDEKAEPIAGGDATFLNGKRQLSVFNDPVRFRPDRGGVILLTEVPRSDIVDVALGLKVNIVGEVVGFLSFIVPLTSDGLRADYVMGSGIEMSF